MARWADPPGEYAPLFNLERARLMEVLEPLAADRDGHRGTPATDGLDEHGFIVELRGPTRAGARRARRPPKTRGR